MWGSSSGHLLYLPNPSMICTRFFTRCRRLTFVSVLLVRNSHFYIYKNRRPPPPTKGDYSPKSPLVPHQRFLPRSQTIQCDNQCRTGISRARSMHFGAARQTPRFARSTPSHIVISVADLEVKFNFPLQHQPPRSSLKSHCWIQEPFPPLQAQAGQDIITYEKRI